MMRSRIVRNALVALLVAIVALPLIPAEAARADYINYPSPVVEQRPDPSVYRHSDGYYYMTATVPGGKSVELRRSTTIAGLADATTQTAFTSPETGAMSGYIWAPDIQYWDGAFYMYFSASPSNDLFSGQRLYYIKNTCSNPTSCSWTAPQRIDTGWESFQLDPESFEHDGNRYLVWAQHDPAINNNSNLYIARMSGATGITGSVTRISVPTLAWETEGYAVNEGPQVIKRNGRIFIAYSASATDARYKLGLLTASDTSDLLDAQSWTKRQTPVFQSANGVYGPGHGDFTVAEDGVTDLLVFHGRPYDPPVPDALMDPNRHTRVQQLYWADNGEPFFGQPLANGMTAPGIRGQGSDRCIDDSGWNTADGATVALWDCNGYTVQEWEFTYTGGYYRIKNRHANKCLDNLGWGTAPGTDVGLWSCNGFATQDWSIIDRGNGWFALKSRHSGLCIDADSFQTANGTDLLMWTCTYGNNQLWKRG